MDDPIDPDVDIDLDRDLHDLPAAAPPRRSRWLPTLDLLIRRHRADGSPDDTQILLVLRWS